VTTKALTPAQVEKLEKALTVSIDPTAAVVRVLLKTGLRIGGVLAMNRQAVMTALKRRPAYESSAWVGLHLLWNHGKNCAETVCPAGLEGARAGYCAYQRCRRLLALAGKSIGIKGLNLQKLRKTVVVRLLRDGVPPSDVQKRLGFATLRGVQYYVKKGKRP